MTRSRNSTKARRLCFATWKRTDEHGRIYMDCQCGQGLRKSCGQRIYPGSPNRDAWRADHGVTRWAEGGEDISTNLFPVFETCDREFKAPEDTSQIAKNKRIHDRRFGIKRAKGFYKPKGLVRVGFGRYARSEDAE